MDRISSILGLVAALPEKVAIMNLHHHFHASNTYRSSCVPNMFLNLLASNVYSHIGSAAELGASQSTPLAISLSDQTDSEKDVGRSLTKAASVH
jgi:hypothetical protein